jgi:hypothetical protein
MHLAILNNPCPCIEQLDMISKPTLHITVRKYIIHTIYLLRVSATLVANFQVGALQRIDILKYYTSFLPMHRYEILNLKKKYMV